MHADQEGWGELPSTGFMCAPKIPGQVKASFSLWSPSFGHRPPRFQALDPRPLGPDYGDQSSFSLPTYRLLDPPLQTYHLFAVLIVTNFV